MSSRPVLPHGLSLVLFGAALSAGCAGTRSYPEATPAMTAEELHIPSATTAKPRGPGQDNLEAIEDFLERTRDYAVLNEPRPQAPAVRQRNTTRIASPRPPVEAVRVESPRTTRGALANAQMTLSEPEPPKPKPALPVLESVSIASARRAEPIVDVDAAANTRTTNTSLDTRPQPAQATADDLLARLGKEAEAANGLAAYWRLRVAQIAFDRHDDRLPPVPSATEETNTLLAATFRALLATRDLLRDPMATGEEALATADELRRLVADRADPHVRNVALCSRVVTFGVYDEMAPTEFTAGRTIHTIVYSELENFRSQLDEDNRFETRLSTRLELLTREGDSVWKHEEPEIIDECRRRRTDFFIAQRIVLPPTIPAGDYVLKVFVEDKLSGRACETTHPLTISSPVTSAIQP